jgi:hypothetical protein
MRPAIPRHLSALLHSNRYPAMETVMTSPPRRSTAVAGLVATGFMLLAACSSSPPTPSANTKPTAPVATSPAATSPASTTVGSAAPCSLLTQAEVDAAAGQSLGPGAQAGALDDCQWSTTDFAASVELDVGDWSAIKAKSAVFATGLTAVPGIGDEALTLNRAGNAAQLYVRKGTTGFLLLLGDGQYIDSLPDLGLAQEKTLAAAVLVRLS